MIFQLKECKDVKKLSVISQFIQLLQTGGQAQEGMAGINQFVTFLSQKEDMARPSSRQSVLGGHSSSVRTR